jgi:glutamyl-tRNA synthetase
MSPPVRVRIAPSPTGDPHVGTAYIALFNYVFAKRHGGKFILRIEDTDRARSSLESEAAILRALKWMGLDWSEGPDVGGPFGPYRQSERTAFYREHAEMLMQKGAAYRCFCTPQRLEELRARQRAEKRTAGYDGHCRTLTPEESARRALAKEPFVIRLAMPRTGETEFKDRLRGVIKFSNLELDDQVLLKSDGFPTYHLANVVDDHLMEITHVIRAEEWISSTPKHVILYRAFGWQEPEWIHMPLLRNADKSKISKRKNPTSLDYYRDVGILPEVLRNYLGLMGWSIAGDREKFTLDEMVEKFDIDRVSLGGPVFDLAKLVDLNGQYMREFSPEELLRRLTSWRLSKEFIARVIPLVRERMRLLSDFIAKTDFLFAGDLDPKLSAAEIVPKGKTPKAVADMLIGWVEALEDPGEDEVARAAMRTFSPKALEEFTRVFCEKSAVETKELFMAVRLAVTGKAATPPLFDTLEVLGRDLTRRRVRQMASFLKTLKT